MEQLIKDQIKAKILPVLNQWAVTFKLIGTDSETPRFSQLLTQGGKFVLKSTQKNLFYNLDLTEAEERYLFLMDSEDRWNWYKQLRTEFLASKHPTIKL